MGKKMDSFRKRVALSKKVEGFKRRVSFSTRLSSRESLGSFRWRFKRFMSNSRPMPGDTSSTNTDSDTTGTENSSPPAGEGVKGAKSSSSSSSSDTEGLEGKRSDSSLDSSAEKKTNKFSYLETTKLPPVEETPPSSPPSNSRLSSGNRSDVTGKLVRSPSTPTSPADLSHNIPLSYRGVDSSPVGLIHSLSHRERGKHVSQLSELSEISFASPPIPSSLDDDELGGRLGDTSPFETTPSKRKRRPSAQQDEEQGIEWSSGDTGVLEGSTVQKKLDMDDYQPMTKLEREDVRKGVSRGSGDHHGVVDQSSSEVKESSESIHPDDVDYRSNLGGRESDGSVDHHEVASQRRSEGVLDSGGQQGLSQSEPESLSNFSTTPGDMSMLESLPSESANFSTAPEDSSTLESFPSESANFSTAPEEKSMLESLPSEAAHHHVTGEQSQLESVSNESTAPHRDEEHSQADDFVETSPNATDHTQGNSARTFHVDNDKGGRSDESGDDQEIQNERESESVSNGSTAEGQSMLESLPSVSGNVQDEKNQRKLESESTVQHRDEERKVVDVLETSPDATDHSRGDSNRTSDIDSDKEGMSDGSGEHQETQNQRDSESVSNGSTAPEGQSTSESLPNVSGNDQDVGEQSKLEHESNVSIIQSRDEEHSRVDDFTQSIPGTTNYTQGDSKRTFDIDSDKEEVSDGPGDHQDIRNQRESERLSKGSVAPEGTLNSLRRVSGTEQDIEKSMMESESNESTARHQNEYTKADEFVGTRLDHTQSGSKRSFDIDNDKEKFLDIKEAKLEEGIDDAEGESNRHRESNGSAYHRGIEGRTKIKGVFDESAEDQNQSKLESLSDEHDMEEQSKLELVSNGSTDNHDVEDQNKLETLSRGSTEHHPQEERSRADDSVETSLDARDYSRRYSKTTFDIDNEKENLVDTEESNLEDNEKKNVVNTNEAKLEDNETECPAHTEEGSFEESIKDDTHQALGGEVEGHDSLSIQHSQQGLEKDEEDFRLRGQGNQIESGQHSIAAADDRLEGREGNEHDQARVNNTDRSRELGKQGKEFSREDGREVLSGGVSEYPGVVDSRSNEVELGRSADLPDILEQGDTEERESDESPHHDESVSKSDRVSDVSPEHYEVVDDQLANEVNGHNQMYVGNTDISMAVEQQGTESGREDDHEGMSDGSNDHHGDDHSISDEIEAGGSSHHHDVEYQSSLGGRELDESADLHEFGGQSKSDGSPNHPENVYQVILSDERRNNLEKGANGSRDHHDEEDEIKLESMSNSPTDSYGEEESHAGRRELDESADLHELEGQSKSDGLPNGLPNHDEVEGQIISSDQRQKTLESVSSRSRDHLDKEDQFEMDSVPKDKKMESRVSTVDDMLSDMAEVLKPYLSISGGQEEKENGNNSDCATVAHPNYKIVVAKEDESPETVGDTKGSAALRAAGPLDQSLSSKHADRESCKVTGRDLKGATGNEQGEEENSGFVEHNLAESSASLEDFSWTDKDEDLDGSEDSFHIPVPQQTRMMDEEQKARSSNDGEIKNHAPSEHKPNLSSSSKPVEFDLEQALREQKTHNLTCPQCGSNVTTSVVLRKRTSSPALDGNVTNSTELKSGGVDSDDKPHNNYWGTWGCLQCLPFFTDRDTEVKPGSKALESGAEGQQTSEAVSGETGEDQRDRVPCLPMFFSPFPWGDRKSEPDILEPLLGTNIERVIREQKTHDLMCPHCASSVTQRILLRRM